MALVDKFAAQPGVTVFLALTVWLVSIFLLRCILDDLLEMHKSKTAVKKIRREYTFLRRLLLHPVREHTEHAVRFTHVMIYVHHLSAASMGLCLLLLLFLPERWQMYILAGRFLLFDVPIMLLDFLLDEHTLKKRAHRRRFRKYHNTPDKTSLF